MGQMSCSFYDKRPISGTGGFFQFIIFAAQARGGRSVAAMTSRSKHNTSRIVPFLPAGAAVDVPAQFAQYVCTECGIVNLRGLSGYERAAALISIAHPDDRDWLTKEARENGLLTAFSWNCRGGVRDSVPDKWCPANYLTGKNTLIIYHPVKKLSNEQVGSVVRHLHTQARTGRTRMMFQDIL